MIQFFHNNLINISIAISLISTCFLFYFMGKLKAYKEYNLLMEMSNKTHQATIQSIVNIIQNYKSEISIPKEKNDHF